MEKTYFNSKVKAQFGLLFDENHLPDLNLRGSFLKFIWNKGNFDLKIQIDNQYQILKPNHIICSIYLQNIKVIEHAEQSVILLFNREFYCVHTNDSEVSCNGLLFFGSNTTPIVTLDPHEVQTLSYLINVLKEEFEIIDSNREEMLRILLKRFIIRCTRLAKQQLFSEAITSDEVDIIRSFNVMVEENYKKVKKVIEYASLMNKSPKTISNIFSQHSQHSPLQIIHQRIIMEAERLINYSNLSAKEIGIELGFEDAAQFSKFFKKSTGYSISEFKKSIN
jgi:AraC-like DNA-binding protein